ncbi:MAG: PrsW family intramembrane metalloprotease [Chloroflexi bacterium]|nr:PrsW family intramembrane metalloprotease [Chloroflexota bacterium]
MASAAELPVCRGCQRVGPADAQYCPYCGRPLAPSRAVVHQVWWKILAIGLVLNWATATLLAQSGNPNLVPTVIFLGAFLVPVVFVALIYELGHLYDVTIPTIALTFFYGGVLGVIAAQLLEENLIVGMGLVPLLIVGLSEELAKPLGVLWIARRREYLDERHGIVLGAAAGMGFAAFETMGYGFTYLLLSRGNLDILGQVLLTRGLLAPLAHGTWTAIVVGTVWRERAAGRGWLNRRVLRGYLTAVVLHALWDWTASAIPISIELPGLALHWRFADLFIPAIALPVPSLLIGLIGLWLLRRMRREAGIAKSTA